MHSLDLTRPWSFPPLLSVVIILVLHKCPKYAMLFFLSGDLNFPLLILEYFPCHIPKTITFSTMIGSFQGMFLQLNAIVLTRNSYTLFMFMGKFTRQILIMHVWDILPIQSQPSLCYFNYCSILYGLWNFFLNWQIINHISRNAFINMKVAYSFSLLLKIIWKPCLCNIAS